MASKKQTASATPSTPVNPDLKAVQTTLIATAKQLDAAVGTAKTADEINALLDELTEVTARVVTVGRQLFTEQSRKIADASKAVLTSAEDAKKAIQKLESVKALVSSLTAFLGLVDKLVDLAKLAL